MHDCERRGGRVRADRLERIVPCSAVRTSNATRRGCWNRSAVGAIPLSRREIPSVSMSFSKLTRYCE